MQVIVTSPSSIICTSPKSYSGPFGASSYDPDTFDEYCDAVQELMNGN